MLFPEGLGLLQKARCPGPIPFHGGISGLLHGVEAERSAVSKYVLCRRYEPLG